LLDDRFPENILQVSDSFEFVENHVENQDNHWDYWTNEGVKQSEPKHYENVGDLIQLYRHRSLI
jgi:hypothetical protein